MEALDEEQGLYVWRRDNLRGLGVDAEEACAFADDAAPDASWHEVEALVKRGCPPDLAVRILR